MMFSILQSSSKFTKFSPSDLDVALEMYSIQPVLSSNENQSQELAFDSDQLCHLLNSSILHCSIFTGASLAVSQAARARRCRSRMQSGSNVTLRKPMSWLFSLKHWRQRLRPYLRIRPAGWVQTRLLRSFCQLQLLCQPLGHIRGKGLAGAWRCGGTWKEEIEKGIPASRAFAKLAWATIPDTFVRHDGGFLDDILCLLC